MRRMRRPKQPKYEPDDTPREVFIRLAQDHARMTTDVLTQVLHLRTTEVRHEANRIRDKWIEAFDQASS